MSNVIRSMAGAFGLAVVCGVIGLLSSTTVAGTLPGEDVVINSAQTPVGPFDADFTAGPSTLSQKAQQQLQQQQMQFRLQVMRWQQRQRGMAHLVSASEVDKDVAASAFDPDSAASDQAAKPPVIKPARRKISIYFNPPDR